MSINDAPYTPCAANALAASSISFSRVREASNGIPEILRSVARSGTCDQAPLLRRQRIGGPGARGRTGGPEPDGVHERDDARDGERERDDREDGDRRYSEAVGDSAPDDVPDQDPDGKADHEAHDRQRRRLPRERASHLAPLESEGLQQGELGTATVR